MLDVLLRMGEHVGNNSFLNHLVFNVDLIRDKDEDEDPEIHTIEYGFKNGKLTVLNVEELLHPDRLTDQEARFKYFNGFTDKDFVDIFHHVLKFRYQCFKNNAFVGEYYMSTVPHLETIHFRKYRVYSNAHLSFDDF